MRSTCENDLKSSRAKFRHDCVLGPGKNSVTESVEDFISIRTHRRVLLTVLIAPGLSQIQRLTSHASKRPLFCQSLHFPRYQRQHEKPEHKAAVDDKL